MQNIQVHHDGLGPFRLAAVLPIEETVKRTNGAIHGNKGLDAGDARERVVPGITIERGSGANSRSVRSDPPWSPVRPRARWSAWASGGSGSACITSAPEPTP